MVIYMKSQNNKIIIKPIIIGIITIVGIAIGFAIDPTAIPINILWAVFLSAIFITSIGIVLLIEAILK